MAQLPKVAMSEDNSDTGGFTVLPEDEYTVQIVKSEWKDTKDKQGKYIQLMMRVVEGEYNGKPLIDRLNLVNPNPVAVDIANTTLNSICAACGKTDVEDTDELHGIPFKIKVSIREASGDWPEQNEIKAYLPDEDFELPWK